ncbi:LacI family DNA-binding transcriptional regulator [Actinoplanes sp. ATCC 53533]|uniref:LacI family DNA-binding transcriptional regulator n=1 Tax=Actinoplanes sp. ATCC 53533 TaxID=1288362 RepID=UPI00131511DD|nr:LacI family DNA-binding transcriptional regulator [Actinoplanes sp. ATCC 53533]
MATTSRAAKNSAATDTAATSRAATSRDVARLAGVAQSTVSYVMSGRRSISAETRRRVESAIEELAFQPNAGARALKSQRTQVIGLMVPFGLDADTSGLLPFIETIANCAREQDHDILLVTRDEGSAGLTRLASRSLCDAIVLMDIETHDARIPVAAALAVPVILIGLPAEPLGLLCVDLDFEQAGRLAVQHLAETGHDRIVLIGHPRATVAREVNFVGRFRRGAIAAADAHGLPHTIVDQPERGPAGVAAALDQALDQALDRALATGPAARDALGLIVHDTEAVQPVLHGLTARGHRPGRDLSVVGLCPEALAESTTPPVTNVSLEPRDVSRRAMRTLFRLLDRDHPTAAAPVELVAARLTRRQTTMPG